MEKFVNILLRIVSLLSKFVFLIYIAKFKNDTLLTNWALFFSLIGYYVYFAGFNICGYCNKKLAIDGVINSSNLLNKQFSFYILVFFCLIPFIVYYIHQPKFILLFCCLILLEHINQELVRALVAVGKVFSANIALFLRQSAWMAIIVGLDYFTSYKFNDIESILLAWLFASLISLPYSLAKLFPKKQLLKIRFVIDLHFIKKAIFSSLLFYLAILLQRGSITIDKAIVSQFFSIGEAAPYLFLFSLAYSMQSIFDAGVGAYAVNIFINNRNSQDFFSLYKTSLLKTLKLSVLTGIGAVIFVYPILNYIGKGEYLKYYVFLPLFVLLNLFISLGAISQLALYGKGLYKKMIKYSFISSILALLAFIASIYYEEIFLVILGLLLFFSTYFVSVYYGLKNECFSS